MKKKSLTIFICISLVTILCLLFIQRSHFSNKQLDKIVIGTKEITISIAETKEEQTRGLSGRTSLSRDEGMLFLFPKKDRYAFWMPDMNFPIDIIWIDHDQVVGVDEHVTNIFDSKNPTYYYPPEPVDTVLEVPDGFFSKNHLTVGSSVSIYKAK